MKHTDPPATKQTAESLLNTFLRSRKRHLILTGSKGSGKTTLLNELLPFVKKEFAPEGIPYVFAGFTTYAVRPHEESLKGSGCLSDTYSSAPSCVRLTDRTTGKDAVIGLPKGGSMQPVTEGFLSVGIKAVAHALESDQPFAVIDEIGFLEESCPPFCDAVWALFEKKRVIAVLRDQSLPFLDRIKNRKDVLVYRTDSVLSSDVPSKAESCLNIGAVVMASGESRRFGSNKLLADFHGKPQLQRILDTVTQVANYPAASAAPTVKEANDILAASPGTSAKTAIAKTPVQLRRVAVTRTPQIKSLCEVQGFPCILHSEPFLSDTIRIGLKYLLSFDKPDSRLVACLFLQGDQPLLTTQSIKALINAFCQDTRFIYRLSYHGKAGSPILFPAAFFDELSQLPPDHGGNVVVRRHAEMVRLVEAVQPEELLDADTPEELEVLFWIN